jgi:hypothetical protein
MRNKLLFNQLILSGFMWVLLTACGISTDNSKFIPQNASYVVCVNIENLMDKVETPENLLNNEFFKSLSGNITLDVEYLLKRLPTSGIDFKSKAYLFGDATEKKENNYNAFSFKINDERAFDTFLNNYPNHNFNIQTFGGVRYTILDNKSILGWMNQVGILLSVNEKSSEKSLRDRLFKLRDLPEEQALKVKNEQFRKLQETKYDFAAWANLEAYNMPIKQFLKKFLILNADLRDNYLISTATFEKGEVFVDLKLFNLNQSLLEYKDILKKDIDKNLISTIPARHPMSVLGFGLDMKGMQKVYKDSGVETLLNTFFNVKEITGSSPQEIMEMMSGDILAVLEDIQNQTDSSEVRYETVLGLGIKKKETLDKILNKLVQSSLLVKKDNFFMSPKGDWLVFEKDQALFLVTKPELKEIILNKAGQFANQSFVQLGERSCVMLFADAREGTRRKLPRSLFRDDRTTEGWIKSANTPIESITLSSRPPKNDITDTRIILAFKDRKINALQALLKSKKWF